jgi:hypothetical protein
MANRLFVARPGKAAWPIRALRGGTNDYHHPERPLGNDSDPPSEDSSNDAA